MFESGVIRLAILILVASQISPHVLAIPTQPERAIDGYTIHSTGFANTHEVCRWLFWRWNAGAEPYNVLSQGAQLLKGDRIKFKCGDNRRLPLVEAAVNGPLREVAVSPTFYYFQCVAGLQTAETLQDYISDLYKNRVAGPKRKYGLCRPKEKKLEPKEAETVKVIEEKVIEPGSLACLDVHAAAFDEFELWLNQPSGDSSPESWLFPSAQTAILSLAEVGTDNHISMPFANRVSLPVDRSAQIGTVYRACAKINPGHGNAIMRLGLTL